ncbi:RNA polymerase sigma-70 factor [Mucilaginibacter rubeus]|uniref:RNA polymerase sigma-70 factor n=1 Tax=Mucilaginibacter rubeus TaxID=2027860 RepID=UPI001AA16398|nr:RNA polymerase sigma-70 factor [Mucilaginibacter rubeus]QTE61737.1 RNA polymerase sigma-70 factor [Mucilaginibacter rubeus]
MNNRLLLYDSNYNIALFNNLGSSDIGDEISNSLHQRLSSGDELAFKLFFQKNQPRLFAYIYKVVKSREIAEELVLDIFVKIWSAKEILSEVENVDAFLHRMAVNKSLDFLRTATREKKIQQLLNQHMQYEQATAAPNHDFKEYNQHVIHCLQMLTQQQQLILNLSREEGLTHEQIADKLNLSKNTVKNHIVTALKKMREFIKHGQLSILLTISFFFIFFQI